MKDGLSDKELIKKYLMTGRKLTGLDALDLFKTTRLAAHIKALRNEGLNIVTTIIETPTKKHVARYHLLRPMVQGEIFKQETATL